MAFHPIEFAKENPAAAGFGVVIIGAVIIYAMGGFRGGSPDNGAAGVTAYYQATAAQAAANNALAVAQVQAQAQTAQTLIAGQVSMHNTDTWAAASTAASSNAKDIAIQTAPYQTEQVLIGTLGQVASKPGATVTSTSHSNGFFGIGGGSSSSTTYVADPAAVSAANLLASLAGQTATSGGGYYVNH